MSGSVVPNPRQVRIPSSRFTERLRGLERRIVAMKLAHDQVPEWASESGLVHGFFGRGGGHSRPPYASLNVSYRVGDDPSAVRQNVCDLKQELGLHGLCITTMHQRHGDRIIDVTEPVKESGDGDAMVARSAGLFLGVLTADCTSILMWSKSASKRVAAVVHAGWRGTLAGLSRKVIEYLNREHGVEPASLHCALGPTIEICCYEVGQDVVEPLRQRWGEMASACVRTADERTYVDLKGLNATLMAETGVPEQQIHRIGPCTACTPEEFYSHRRATKARSPQTGRQMSVIGWRD